MKYEEQRGNEMLQNRAKQNLQCPSPLKKTPQRVSKSPVTVSPRRPVPQLQCSILQSVTKPPCITYYYHRYIKAEYQRFHP